MKIKDFENMVIYKATNPDNIKGEAASVETGTKPTYHVDSSPLSEDEVKDFKQLYDNDFGARNERVLDYNHPEYIKSGINKGTRFFNLCIIGPSLNETPLAL